MRAQPQTGSKLHRLVGYGVGDFGLNIYWNILLFWLLYWYTNIVGLKPEVAGFIFLIGTLWDGISDPIVASLSERVRTKYGTFRPFIVYGSLLLGICLVLLFYVPPLEGSALIAALIGISIAFRTAYTLVAVPYSALSSRLSFDSIERTEYAGVRMFFAFSGLLVVSLLFPPLARSLGSGSNYTNSGFMLAAAVGAVVATLALLICFLNTRELPIPGRDQQPPLTLANLFEALKKNRALILLLWVISFEAAASSAINLPMVFIIESDAERFASKEVVMTAFAILTMVGVVFWTFFTRLFSRKIAWATSATFITICSLHMLLFGVALVEGIPLQILGLAFSKSAFAVLIWSYVADTVEYGQISAGLRSEGVVYGAMMFVQKLSIGLTGWGFGQWLSGMNYGIQPGMNMSANLDELLLFIAVIPSVLLIISSFLIWFFPLDRHSHANIVGKLQSAAAGMGHDEGDE